jgi:hypothetical protein
MQSHHMRRTRPFFGAAVLVALACSVPSPYRPPPDGSFTTSDATLEIANVTTTIHATSVTPAFFPATAGVPLLGRVFLDSDHGGAAVVVLSSPLWASNFGKNPAIIGRPVRVDGRNAVIIGVMPEQFQIPDGTDVWRLITP